jgi:hypothetical protein
MDFLHRKAVALALSRALRGVVAQPLAADDVSLSGGSVGVSTLTFLPFHVLDGSFTASLLLQGVELDLGNASVVVDKLTARVQVRAASPGCSVPSGGDADRDGEPASGAAAAAGVDALPGAAAAIVVQLLQTVTEASCLRVRHAEVVVEPATLLPAGAVRGPGRPLPAVQGLLLELHGATVSLAAGIAPRQPRPPGADSSAPEEERLDAAAGVRCALERMQLRLLFDDTDGAAPPVPPLLELLPPPAADNALANAAAAAAVRLEAAFDAATPLQLPGGAGSPPLLVQPISVELARMRVHVSPHTVLACARLAAAMLSGGSGNGGPGLHAVLGRSSRAIMAASSYSAAAHTRRQRGAAGTSAMGASVLSVRQPQGHSMVASLLDPSLGQLPRAVPGVVDAALRSVATYFATAADDGSMSASVMTAATAAVTDGGYGDDDGGSCEGDDDEGDTGAGSLSSLWGLLPPRLQALSAGLLRARGAAMAGAAASSAPPDDASDDDSESGGSGGSVDLHRQVASLTESFTSVLTSGGTGRSGDGDGRRDASAPPRPLSVSLTFESLLAHVYGDDGSGSGAPRDGPALLTPLPALVSLELRQADCHLVPGVLATAWLLHAEVRHGAEAGPASRLLPSPQLAVVSDVTVRLVSGAFVASAVAAGGLHPREVRTRSVALTATAAQAVALAQQADSWRAAVGEATALLSPAASASPPAAAPAAGGLQTAPLRVLVDRLDATLVTQWRGATAATSVAVQGAFASIRGGSGGDAAAGDDGGTAAVSVVLPRLAVGVADSLRAALTCSPAAATAPGTRARAAAPLPAPVELRLLDVRPPAEPSSSYPAALAGDGPPLADVRVRVGEVALLLDGRRVRALAETAAALQAAASLSGAAAAQPARQATAASTTVADNSDGIGSVSAAVGSVAVMCFLPDGLEPVLTVSGVGVTRTVATAADAPRHVRVAASVRSVVVEAAQNQHSVTLLSAAGSGAPVAGVTAPATAPVLSPALQVDALLPAAVGAPDGSGGADSGVVRADVALARLRLDDPVLLALVGVGCTDVWMRSSVVGHTSPATVSAPPATAPSTARPVRLRLRLPEVDVFCHHSAAVLPTVRGGREAAVPAAPSPPLAASAHVCLRAVSVLAELKPAAVLPGATAVHAFAEVGEVTGSLRAHSPATAADGPVMIASTKRARRASPSRVVGDDALTVSVRGLQAGVHYRPSAHTSQQHVLLQQAAVTVAAEQLPLLASAVVHARHDAARLAAAYHASAAAVARANPPPATSAATPTATVQRSVSPVVHAPVHAQPPATPVPAATIAHHASSDDSEDFVSEPVVAAEAHPRESLPPQSVPSLRGGLASSTRTGGSRWTSRRTSGGSGGGTARRPPGPSVCFMDEVVVIDDLPQRPRQHHRAHAPAPPSSPPQRRPSPALGIADGGTPGGWAQLQSRSSQLQAAAEGATAASGCRPRGDSDDSDAAGAATHSSSSTANVVEASLTLKLPSAGTLSVHASRVIVDLASGCSSLRGDTAAARSVTLHRGASAATSASCYSVGSVTVLECLPASVGGSEARGHNPPHALLTVTPSDDRAAAWSGVAAPAILLQLTTSPAGDSEMGCAPAHDALANGLAHSVDAQCGPLTLDVRGRLVSALDALAASPTTLQAAAIVAAPAPHAGIVPRPPSPSQSPSIAHFVSVTTLQLTFSFDPEGRSVRLELAEDGVGLAIDDGSSPSASDDAGAAAALAPVPHRRRRHTILHAPRVSHLLQSLFHARIGASIACVRLAGVRVTLPTAGVGPVADGAAAGRALADVYCEHLNDVTLPALALSLPRAVLAPLVERVWSAGSQAALAAAAHVGGALPQRWRLALGGGSGSADGDAHQQQQLDDAYAHTAEADGSGDVASARVAGAAPRAAYYSLPREAVAVVRQVVRAVAYGLAGALHGVLLALLGGGGGIGDGGSQPGACGVPAAAAAVAPLSSPDATDWVHI